jgi:hypothetical protein
MKNISALLTLILFFSHLANAEWRGNITLDDHIYFENGLYPDQHKNNPSLSLEPEYITDLFGGDFSFIFKPFLRIDAHDDERTHFDIRELNLYTSQGDWEWRAGLGKVFWGVTESQHLVDIINQIDFVENIDGEDKLGQPLINATLSMDSGVLDFFILPGFRERTFPGKEGRLRPPLAVNTERSEYESSAKKEHIDFALRWNGTVKNDWDIGLHYFNGTSRDPQLISKTIDGRPTLIPRYNQINQVGIDLQATLEEWIWKLEAIRRQGEPDDYSAAVGGFEYTFVGIQDSNLNLGMLMEYHWDSRHSGSPSPFQNDIFIGSRLDLSDEQSTEILIGGLFDLDSPTRSFRLEAARRLGQNWRLTGELQIFEHIDEHDIQFSLRNDGFISLELARYF